MWSFTILRKLATDSATGTLYFVEWRSGADMGLWTISGVDGSRALVGTMVGLNQAEGLSFAPTDVDIPTIGGWGALGMFLLLIATLALTVAWRATRVRSV